MSKSKRYIYASEAECQKVRELVLSGNDGDRLALIALQLQTINHLVPQEGITQKSAKQLMKCVAGDESEFLSMLPRLASAGIHYDIENEVLVVDSIAQQYAEFSATNGKRLRGVRRALDTIPDCLLKARVERLYPAAATEEEKETESEGVASDVASQVTSHVTLDVTSDVSSGLISPAEDATNV